MPFDPKRRSFIAGVTGLASVTGVALGARGGAGDAAPQTAPPRAATPQKWDTAWIDQFKGKHKQVQIKTDKVSIRTTQVISWHSMSYVDWSILCGI